MTNRMNEWGRVNAVQMVDNAPYRPVAASEVLGSFDQDVVSRAANLDRLVSLRLGCLPTGILRKLEKTRSGADNQYHRALGLLSRLVNPVSVL